MSHKELNRAEIMQQIASKKITQCLAAEQLGLSIRHVKRLYAGYKLIGAGHLISKRRGKPSNHKLSNGIQEYALSLISQCYADFGPTLTKEKLESVHKLDVSVSTVRTWMAEAGLWIPRAQRLKRAYQPRYRRSCYGELVQIDGSDHHWFEKRGPRCTLLVFIDDATSQLMMARFVPEETTFTYFDATKRYLLDHGKPIAFYSDKYSVFRRNCKEAKGGDVVTQYARALSDLNIDLINANTCQAKGRVERANKTLQDRLIKELRLLGISTTQEANEYLPEFIQIYNQKFGKEPRSETDVHRALQEQEKQQLEDIFSWQEDRTLSRNLTLQYDKVLYLVQDTAQNRALARKRVTVYENYLGRIKIKYEDTQLAYRTFDKLRKVDETAIVENKRLDNVLAYIKLRQEQRGQQQRSQSCPSRAHLVTG
jgi:hypothetical protein